MRLTKICLVWGFSMVTMTGPLSAGPLIKMIEQKKASQASSSSKTTPPSSQATPTPAKAESSKAESKFETSKTKCKELGNPEGSDKFNRCVVTLME